jgi:hypothetical protein
MPDTMKLLPETDEKTVCVLSIGLVESDDFINVFEKPFRERIARYGSCSAYVKFDENFLGWTPEGAEASFKCITDIAPHVRKVAYVNAPDSRRLLTAMVQPLSDGEVRFYDLGQEEEAMKWVKE